MLHNIRQFYRLYTLVLFQLTADTVNLETGQSVLLNVVEELKQRQEPAQTLLLHMEERTVLELAPELESATPVLVVGKILHSPVLVAGKILHSPNAEDFRK